MSGELKNLFVTLLAIVVVGFLVSGAIHMLELDVPWKLGMKLLSMMAIGAVLNWLINRSVRWK